MTAIVYRQLPDRPKRQYIQRLIDNRLPLWRTDPHVALRMERNDAKRLAETLRQRSTGYGGKQAVREPVGEYGIEDVTA